MLNSGIVSTLVIMNKAMNIHIQDLCGHTFSFILGNIPRSGIAGSHGNSMFNVLRNCQTVFPSSCIILHSRQECVRGPVSQHARQHFLLSISSILSIVEVVKWELVVALIFISLMTNDVEDLFMCLLAMCISSLENACINLLSFKKFLLLSCNSSL